MSQMPPQQQGAPDKFYTDPRAIVPLLPYLPHVIWECAAGTGNIVRALNRAGHAVWGTDVDQFEGRVEADFLTYSPPFSFDAIVTNPPYSIKDKFITRCYEFSKPWAMLMPVAALGGKRRQSMYREHGLQIIMLGERLQFIAPPAKGAWQEHAWFTWGLNLPQDIVFATLD